MEYIKRKNQRIKRQVKHKDATEHGLYYNLKHTSHFDVLVSLRIGKKQLQRKKKNIQFIGDARKIRDNFVIELEAIKAEVTRGDILWSQALDMYIKNLESLLKTNEMSQSTYESRKSTLIANTEAWSTKKLSDFHLEFIKVSLTEKLKLSSHATKKNVYKLVKQVFQHQISMGNRILKYNPAGGIRTLKTQDTKPETISKANMEKIIQYVHGENSKWAPVYYLAYQLGCRSGELYALKWSDVNWAEKNITVGKSFCWKSGKEKLPKNNRYRILPLNNDCYDYLIDLKMNTTSDDVFILPRITAWKEGRAAKILASFQTKLGIDRTNFHSIRSTFITQLLLDDVAPVKVMELAGHQDFKSTLIYVRSVAKELNGTTDGLSLKINTAKVVPIKKPA